MNRRGFLAGLAGIATAAKASQVAEKTGRELLEEPAERHGEYYTVQPMFPTKYCAKWVTAETS